MAILAAYTSVPNRSEFREHRHDTWEITLNISGEGTNYLGGEATPFRAGTILIAPPGVPHSKRTQEGCFQDISIVFDDHYLMRKLDTHVLQDDEDHTIETLMRMIFRNFCRRTSSADIVAQHLFEALCRSLSSMENCSRGQRSDLIQNEIIRNFTNPEFKISDVMEKTGYCKDYIRRCFKEEQQMTPVEFLNKTRIDYAKTLLADLAEPAYSIAEIAYMSGFYDVGYFSRVFKKREHITPIEYRRTRCAAPDDGGTQHEISVRKPH